MFKKTGTIAWSIVTIILLAVITNLKDFYWKPWAIIAVIVFGIGMALSAIALSISATNPTTAPKVERASKIISWIGLGVFLFCLVSIAVHTIVYDDGKIFGDTKTTQEETAIAPTNNDEYHWGWRFGETKNLKPDYVVGGDVTVDGVEYFDQGGVNEATLVVNLSSRELSVYSGVGGSGEFMFSDKDFSVTNMVRDEFATGGDPDAKTVRVVVVTDNGITQTWYDSNLQVIKTITD